MREFCRIILHPAKQYIPNGKTPKHTPVHSKQTNYTIHLRRTNNINHLNNCTNNHPSIHRNTIRTITTSNRRSTQSSSNIKSSWTKMILNLWILRFHKLRVWFIYSTTRKPTNKYIPTIRYRQSNCTTNKFTNPNNRYQQQTYYTSEQYRTNMRTVLHKEKHICQRTQKK